MTYEFAQSVQMQGGRFELFVPPTPHRYYSLGLDFAFGLSGSDFDAGVILDDQGEQIAEFEGRWGAGFGKLLIPILEFFGPHRLFICGEATATGIPILQSLFNLGYWLYFRQSEDTKGTPISDRLGHAPGRLDVTVTKLRLALGRQSVKVRSQRLFEQLCAYRFMPRRTGVQLDADLDRPDMASFRDSDVRMGAPAGEHDDLLRALALAQAGLEWLPMFDPPRPKAPAGSYAQVLGWDSEAASSAADQSDEDKEYW